MTIEQIYLTGIVSNSHLTMVVYEFKYDFKNAKMVSSGEKV